MIYTIATDATYNKYDSSHNVYYYHLMVSLRPYFNKTNTDMGYCASHLDCACHLDNPLLKLKSDLTIASFSVDDFWKQARVECEKLHERLDKHEPIEMASQDSHLIGEIETQTFVNGGGVHFALSNLGTLSSRGDAKLTGNVIELDEFYYQVSLESYRWSSLVFNGISTLDGNLMWGITYNSQFIRAEIIQYIIKCIKILINKLTEE